MGVYYFNDFVCMKLNYKDDRYQCNIIKIFFIYFQVNNNKLKCVYNNEKFKLQNIFEEIKKKEDIIKICRNDLESKSNYNSRYVHQYKLSYFFRK